MALKMLKDARCSEQCLYLFSFHGVGLVELDDGRALGRVVEVQGDPDALLVPGVDVVI
jgi:hypothetical protein